MIPDMQDAVLTYAQGKVGFKEEPGNMGFKDKAFDSAMRMVGFENTWAWCALFAELCWAYPTYDDKYKVVAGISDNFSANAVKTFENFANDSSGFFGTFEDMMPSPGDVVIWEKRKNGRAKMNGIWTIGHAGIVESAGIAEFKTIEGNSNSSGGREGIEVARQTRPYNYSEANGLALKGFITAKI